MFYPGISSPCTRAIQSRSRCFGSVPPSPWFLPSAWCRLIHQLHSSEWHTKFWLLDLGAAGHLERNHSLLSIRPGPCHEFYKTTSPGPPFRFGDAPEFCVKVAATWGGLESFYVARPSIGDSSIEVGKHGSCPSHRTRAIASHEPAGSLLSRLLSELGIFRWASCWSPVPLRAECN